MDVVKLGENRRDLDECSDEELFTRIQRGERDLFGTLIRRYEAELFGYLRRYVRDAILAEDVFQNTFVQLYLKQSHYEPGKPLRPWIYTIATNQAIDALRRSGREQAVSLDSLATPEADHNPLMENLSDQQPGPLDATVRAERDDLIRESVDRLPEPFRQSLILAYFQGLKYREIADILGVPVGTVKSRVFTAITRLQELLNAAIPPTDA